MYTCPEFITKVFATLHHLGAGWGGGGQFWGRNFFFFGQGLKVPKTLLPTHVPYYW